MRNQKLRRKILEATEGVLATATDVMLSELFFGLATITSGGGPTSRKAWRDAYAADEMLSEINYVTLKRAFYHLKRRGLIELVKEEALTIPKITEHGRKRLESVLPQYYSERPWDRKIYLITYDIPEDRRTDREKLRRHLKKIGCGMLQASVWLTPYNPRDILNEVIRKERIAGSIIISDVGKDGSIGQRTLKELVADVYNLHGINSDYRDFTEKYSKKTDPEVSPMQIAIEFFAVLKEDPQLPFELLPLGWQGGEAYDLFKKLTGEEQLTEKIT